MLTRKMLSAMEIAPEKIDEIINSHADSVNALKEQLDSKDSTIADLEQKVKDLPTITKERDEAQKKLKAMTDDGLADKYATLQKEYDDYKAEVENEKIRAEKTALFKEVLSDVGITVEKDVAKVIKYSDIDSMEIEDGKLKGSGDIAKAIKEEWAELCKTTSKEGVDTPKPPEGGGGSAFDSMSLADKMAYANDHPKDEAVIAWLKK